MHAALPCLPAATPVSPARILPLKAVAIMCIQKEIRLSYSYFVKQNAICTSDLPETFRLQQVIVQVSYEAWCSWAGEFWLSRCRQNLLYMVVLWVEGTNLGSVIWRPEMLFTKACRLVLANAFIWPMLVILSTRNGKVVQTQAMSTGYKNLKIYMNSTGVQDINKGQWLSDLECTSIASKDWHGQSGDCVGRG